MTIPTWLQLVLYALAVLRITGLIVTDTIFDEPRDALLGWLDDRPATLGSFIAQGIQCYWCAGMWVSLVAAPLVWLWGDTPVMLIPAMALALSQFIGMFSDTGR